MPLHVESEVVVRAVPEVAHLQESEPRLLAAVGPRLAGLCRIRQLPIVIDQDTFTPWGGFDWTRRTLPNTTIARGRGTVATKSDRIRHAAFLEAGKENINAFRYQTKGYISDQARSERGVQKAPFGDKEEISIVLAKLRSGELFFENPRAREMMFLYNALEQTGNLHIMFNAVEHAIKAVREWPKFQEGLRSFCKVCGEPSYKALVLKECFASAPKEARARLHQFSGQHVDFKWEHLEEIFLLGGGLDCGLFWDMNTYFVASCLSPKDSTIAHYCPDVGCISPCRVQWVLHGGAVPFYQCCGEGGALARGLPLPWRHPHRYGEQEEEAT